MSPKIGTIYLSPNIILKNVLYIPKFEFNLVSVSKAYEDSFCRAIFNPKIASFMIIWLAN